jgi:hypothetical protein
MAVHHRHLDIHQDEVWLQSAGGIDGLLAVGGRLGPEAERRQLTGEEISISTAVVRDQNGAALGHRSGRQRVHGYKT